MVARSHSEIKRFRYLLGLCSQAERERIEAEYFENEAAFQAMLAAEDDLIDAYARGELTDEERQRFETHFLTSVRGRERVQFAHAFARAISSAAPVETKPHATWLNIFESLRRWPLRVATAAVVIVLIGAISWIFVERRRMGNEAHDSRAERETVTKQVESLPVSGDAGRARTGLQPENLPGGSDKSRRRKSAVRTQRTREVPIDTVEMAGGIAGRILGDERLVNGFLMFPARPGEALINTSDATLGNKFERTEITELPLEERNVVGLLSLQPELSVGGGFLFSLPPRSTTPKSTITVADSIKLIKLRLGLKTAAQRSEYSAVIETADGRQVTSIHWTEPLTPDSNSLDTPDIPSSELPSGEYVLLLSGKEIDGSFVRLAEYYFKVIRNQ